MATHFSGPVISEAGFEGTHVGGLTQSSVNYTADGAIALADNVSSISKGSAAAMTLAAPGAGNVGRFKTILVTTTFAHVVVATGLLGGTTLTFSTIGEAVLLYAFSATQWVMISNNGAVQSA